MRSCGFKSHLPQSKPCILQGFFIPASYEPRGHVYMSIWQLPPGPNTPIDACIAASLMPRVLAPGPLTVKRKGNQNTKRKGNADGILSAG